jgi:hypothetical protein
MSARAVALLVVAVFITAATGCGGADGGGGNGPAKLGAQGYADLFVELSKAAPHGSLSPEQAAATAERQSVIAGLHAAKLRDGACKTSLQALSTAYDRYGKASRSTSAQADPKQLVTAAQRVVPAVKAVQRDCA